MQATDLSVVMPNYNHAPYLARAIRAVLDQSVRPRELIVVDDCSTDDSVAIIEQFVRRDSIVRLVRNECNLGACGSLERGISLATGDYLFCGAADDYVLPGFIEKSMEMLHRYPKAGLACAYHSTVDEASGVVARNASALSDAPCYLSGEEVAERIGLASIPGHSTVFSRKSYEKAGAFPAELRWHCDWFTLLVIAFREGICHLPEPLALMTVRSASFSAQGRRDVLAQREVLAALLGLLASEQYRDVAPLFWKSGVMGAFGPELLRAAVASQHVSALNPLTSLSIADCEELLQDDDADVRAVASEFLCSLLRQKVASMESSTFWKMRCAWFRTGRALRRGLGVLRPAKWLTGARAAATPFAPRLPV